MTGTWAEDELASAPVLDLLNAVATFQHPDDVEIRRFRWTGVVSAFARSEDGSASVAWTSVLESSAARLALPEILEPLPFPLGNPPPFEPVVGGATNLDGLLFDWLLSGGPYGGYTGTRAAAWRIAGQARTALVPPHWKDVDFLANYDSWSPWFRNTGWDLTWALVDRRLATVTLIVTTDSD